MHVVIPVIGQHKKQIAEQMKRIIIQLLSHITLD